MAKKFAMTDLYLLSPAQMAKIEPFFPLSHGVPRVDDRRVISGIIYVLKHGLQWKDAPKDYGRLEGWRRIATRHDRRADVFMAAITIAAIVIWWLQ
ncbi:Transposase [Pannonibacter indicus]|uniref:Transposase n=2 Tax=Pannonibacter indicus TaxID=466044 RepID=A0A0K6I8C9_9HYPH|nr:Transposase [Pannonibacter indicus]